ncbi:MAG: hypothetical protein V3T17_09895 [Pseudomonadales bacterium]
MMDDLKLWLKYWDWCFFSCLWDWFKAWASFQFSRYGVMGWVAVGLVVLVVLFVFKPTRHLATLIYAAAIRGSFTRVLSGGSWIIQIATVGIVRFTLTQIKRAAKYLTSLGE